MALSVKLDKSPFGITSPEAYAKITDVTIRNHGKDADGKPSKSFQVWVSVYFNKESAETGSPLYTQKFEFPFDKVQSDFLQQLYGQLKTVTVNDETIAVDFTQGVDA